jgi:hypothetical protein
MPQGTLRHNLKPTSPAINNVESRAGIAQPEGAAVFESCVAVSAMVSSSSAPNETGDLI